MEFKKFVKIRKEKFGAIIFDTLREKVFVTNQTGQAVLELLEAGKPLENIPQLLTSKFNGDSSRIKNEAVAFIKGLEEKDLLVN